jgi:hypothetical protein
MFNVTQSLATNGSFSADPCTPGPRSAQCVPGIDGRNYAGFGLVPSIVAVPGYIVSRLVASLVRRDMNIVGGLVIGLYHVLLTAAIPVLLGLWLAQIGFSARAIIWGVAAYAFASPAWWFGTHFCSEPYFAAGLIGCCYWLSRNDKYFSLGAAGACFGFAVGSRLYGLILLPIFVLYGLLLWRSRNRSGSTIMRNLLAFGAPMGLCIGLIALANQIRFGSAFKTGYHLAFPTTSDLLSTPLVEGIKNLLFNGEVGVFIFVPWVVMLPLLWGRFWRRSRNEAILALGIVVTSLLFFAKYAAWHGGWFTGPRMLNGVFSFLIPPMAMLFDNNAERSQAWTKRISGALLGLTCLIQIVLAIYPVPRYYHMQDYNQQHAITEWWSGKPLLEAITAIPDLLFGKTNPPADPASRYLLTLPNPINQTRADLWPIKAPLLGLPHFIAWFLAVSLLTVFVIGMRTVLSSCSELAEGDSAQS